ncbi:PREDICTED: ejaculatory bulb-specific protein 3-like [Dinoponera quadriceps]|uniref:Ejaculatory bulb-specific protein 3-like n=1 Tax=Dinoponera quadriceps TaxID=609295 RepID=A0A6P3XCH7_DINQU|nr:PREDICTED: ejaculatory bulb-specific protein 3-like [Dinoponera quadriceps]
MLATAHSLKMISLAHAFVVCTVIYIVLFADTTNGQHYSSKYDTIDIEAILDTPRLRNQYVNCILNVSPCVTGAARYLKENYAEAFVTRCKKCTEKQAEFFDKVADWFTKNDPETWDRAIKLAIKELRDKNS